MSDTVERYRKFCKIIGLHSVFNTEKKIENGEEKTFYNTSFLFKPKVDEVSKQLPVSEGDSTLPITKDTVIFITADSIDGGNKIEISTEDNIKTTRTLYEFDTMLWVNGNIYSLSQKNVKNIYYNTTTDKLDIVYSDDFIQAIDITAAQLSNEFIVNFPLYMTIENDNEDGKNIQYNLIQLFGQDKNESGRNFVIGMYEDEKDTPSEYNNTYNNLKYTTIIGKGNIASKDGQIILGDFNESTNSKFIVCNGGFDEELQTYVRKNLFTISDGGKVLALDDFVLSKETNIITHKLSDIHSVTVDDWYKEPKGTPGVDVEIPGQQIPGGSLDVDPEPWVPGGSIDR